MNQSFTHALATRMTATERQFKALSEDQNGGVTPDLRTKTAIRLLVNTLEGLRLAAEHLQIAADDIAEARRAATASARRYRELHEGLPVACVMTD